MISICSLLENNKDVDEIKIYLICNSISDATQNQIRQIIEEFKREIVFINKDKIDTSFIKQSDYSYSGYYRLFASEIIKEDKILYLDCDTIVLDSLKSLWEINLDGYILAGVRDTVEDFNASSVGVRDNSKYVNAGVMLFNLKEMREINFTKQVIDCFQLYRGYVPHHDQGVINYVAKDRILYLPIKYNLMSQYLLFNEKQLKRMFNIKTLYSDDEVNLAKTNPVIVHFLNKFYGRPWEEGCENPFKDRFIAYSEKYGINLKLVQRKSNAKNKKIEVRKNIYKHCPFGVFLIIEKILYYHRRRAFRKIYKIPDFDRETGCNEDIDY